MREILFRGKRVDNSKWIFGGYAKCNNRHYILTDIDLISREWVFKNIEVVSETVGQYTGLTDKNGKKIFEGDIVKLIFESYTHSWGDVGVVTEFCGAYGTESADEKHFCAFINESVYTRSREVIGNIHDNPELLKEDKQ